MRHRRLIRISYHLFGFSLTGRRKGWTKVTVVARARGERTEEDEGWDKTERTKKNEVGGVRTAGARPLHENRRFSNFFLPLLSSSFHYWFLFSRMIVLVDPLFSCQPHPSFVVINGKSQFPKKIKEAIVIFLRKI